MPLEGPHGAAALVGVPAPAVPGSRLATPTPPEPTLEPEVVGGGLLGLLERGFLYLDRVLGRVLPEPLNPFLHTGAITLTTLLVATVTGVVLLVWYRPSVHLAYGSVAGMAASPYTAQLLRSLHRYSSDAAVFFAVVHALRLFFERRFTGPRWIAWLTGVAALALLWFVGWTGYWLVWDARAQHVALGTARPLDVLPIFADPMGRSFLTDEGVNSLLFFVVFFFHMLVPLAMGVALWLHLARLARPKFVTRRPMTIWTLGVLLLLSLAYPATNAQPASMTAVSQQFTIDAWYLLPLLLTDRLGGGALWALALVASAVVGAAPWWMRRREPAKAFVTVERCNACLQCYQDCPFDAITMLPRSDGRDHPAEAHVNPDKCVGCGICVGSCSGIGTDLYGFGLAAQRRLVEGWLKEAVARGRAVRFAFTCAHAAGAGLAVDSDSGLCEELPGWRVLEVPCAGWFHALTAERLLQRGAKDVAIVACAPGGCHYREGADWLVQRLDGSRPPEFDAAAAPRERVHVLSFDRTRKSDLVGAALAIAGGSLPAAAHPPGRATAGLAATALAALVALGLGAASDVGYATPGIEESELVVTFKHPGRVGENCRDLSEEEKAKLPRHMRRDRVCDRARADVWMRVAVDGAVVHEGAYEPKGIWHDGNSIAIERIVVVPGEHWVRVEIGDSLDPGEWTFRSEQTVSFSENARRVLAFDRLAGFTLH